MSARAIDGIVDALRDHGCHVAQRGTDKYEAQCPAHDDTNPSLSVRLRDRGDGVVLHCHAGCQIVNIVAALGWRMRDLFDDPRKRAAYNDWNTYTYADGRKVHRKPGKDFPQSGNKQGNMLFRAERITAETDPVFVVEGEKDVLVAESEGAVAVCSAMGAGKASKFDSDGSIRRSSATRQPSVPTGCNRCPVSPP